MRFRRLLLLAVLGATLVGAQGIQQVEYFIDNDPGYGDATQVDIAPGDHIDTLITVDITGISSGFHALFVRVRDDSVWSLAHSRPFYLEAADLTADRHITAAEYFIDDDPGYGVAIPVSITADSSINQLFTVSLDNLTAGFHALFVRVRDAAGFWSLANSRPFYLETADLTADRRITAVEYFIDDDPGYGVAIPVTITADSSINQLFPVDLGGLSPGFHALFVRVRDVAGYWSLANSRPFYLEAADLTADRHITAAEYFIDNDPGYGLATPVTFVPDSSVDQLFAVDLDTLSSGFHALFVRVRDAAGYWSLANSRPFYLEAADLAADRTIMAAEYFVDNDPGYGLASPIVITADSSINELFIVDLDTLAAGMHTFHTRVLDASGQWSHAAAKPFYLDPSDLVPVPDIVSLQYQFTSTSGFESPQRLYSGLVPSSDIDVEFNPDLTGLTPDSTYLMHLVVTDGNGLTSLEFNSTFLIAYGAYITITTDSLDFGFVAGDSNDSLTFTVHNVGDSTLTVSNLDIASPFSAELSSMEILPNDSALATVTFAPVDSQAYTGKLTIQSDALDYPEIGVFLKGRSANSPPIAVFDSVETLEDQPITINVLANDHDSDLDRLTVASVSTPLHGQASIAGDSAIVYTPASNYFGLDSLQYFLTDGLGKYDSAAVFIEIKPVNDRPNDFELLTITGDSLILITQALLGDSLIFAWTEATDVDNDSVYYHFDLSAGLDLLLSADTAGTSINIRLDSIATWIYESGETSISGTWNILALDGIDTTWVQPEPLLLTIDISTLDIRDLLNLPTVFALHQNYPNPFNPVTTIQFDLPVATELQMIVYDLLGRELTRLVDQHLEPGFHRVAWDSRDHLGRELPTGMYLVLMKSPEFRKSIKVVLLK